MKPEDLIDDMIVKTEALLETLKTREFGLACYPMMVDRAVRNVADCWGFEVKPKEEKNETLQK